MTQEIKSASLRGRLCKWNRDEVPESSEPLDPQQGTRRQLGESLAEEEERRRTPVLRAQLPNHLQQHPAWEAEETAVQVPELRRHVFFDV